MRFNKEVFKNNFSRKLIEILTLLLIVIFLLIGLITLLVRENGLFEDYRFARIVLSIIGIIFITTELLFNFDSTKDDTTNVILYKWSKDKYFFIPFAFGAIGGHLFLGAKEALFPSFFVSICKEGIMPVFALAFICAIMYAIGFKYKFDRTIVFFSLLLFLGLLYGHFIWSMNYL